jgi:hypothetical protein
MSSRIQYSSQTNKPKLREPEVRWDGTMNSRPRTGTSSGLPTTLAQPRLYTHERTTNIPIRSNGARPVQPSARNRSTAQNQNINQFSSNPAESRLHGYEAGMGVRIEAFSAPPQQINRLRRKASSVDQRSQYTATESSGSIPAPAEMGISEPVHERHDPYSDSIFGVSISTSGPPSTQISMLAYSPTQYATSSSRMAQFASSQPPPTTSLPDVPLPPVTPDYSRSAPTRYTESPGAFSRTSTPTSASSYSPNVQQGPKFGARSIPAPSINQSRPPVTRRKLTGEESIAGQALPAVKESGTSSSSSSVIRVAETVEIVSTTAPKNKKRSEVPAPTPPLRLSSKRTPKAPISNPIGDKVEESKAAIATKTTPTSSTKSANPTMTSEVPFLSPDAPPRPSREGTPVLEQKANPVIRSNMSHVATTGHTRRASRDKAAIRATTFPELSRIGSPKNTPRALSKVPAPSKEPNATSPHLYPREASRTREVPKLNTNIMPKPMSRDPSPMQPSSGSSTSSRFGFFSRRVKTPVSAEAPAHVPNKLHKKGPAAGTGHEGYGKYARRGRTNTVSTTASSGRSPSIDVPVGRLQPSSRKSSFNEDKAKPQLDDFLKERLEPVVMGGGGIKENRNSNTSFGRTTSGDTSQSNSLDYGSRLQDSHPTINTSMSASSLASSLNSLASSLPPSKLSVEISRTSSETRSLAHRRSLHRSQLGKVDQLSLPAPIRTSSGPPSESVNSFDTCQSALNSDTSLDLSDCREGIWLKPKKAEKKLKLPSKWNFFQRSQNGPRKLPQALKSAPLAAPAEMTAAVVTKAYDTRQPAHYAIIENSEVEEGSEEVDELLRDIEDDLRLRKANGAFKTAVEIERKLEQEYAVLLPTPPMMPTKFTITDRPASPLVQVKPLQREQQQKARQLQTPAEVAQATVKKESRLQQIGRIPRVVSKRDRPHKPAPHSFSRPFFNRPSAAVDVPQSALLPPMEDLQQPAPLSDLSQTDPIPSLLFENPFQQPDGTMTNGMLYNLEGEGEFLRLSPRNNSEITSSTTSLNLAAMTAILPRTDAIPGEDEVWDEYDELIDHVASPLSYITANGQDASEALEHFPGLMLAKSMSQDWNQKGSPSRTGKAIKPIAKLENSKPALSQRSELPQLLQPPVHAELPTSPSHTLSSIYANYATRINESPRNSIIRDSVSSSIYSCESVPSQHSHEKSTSATSDGSQNRQVSRIIATKIVPIGMSSTESVRFSALMTSRWLTFDRVLFSPAAVDIRPFAKDRVLVLDGLGNDDWSCYCALTYPDATLYSLASPSTIRSISPTSQAWIPPSNHRLVSHSSPTHPFPFPKGFFTAVVLRFPAASSEAVLNNVVMECKRVLKPGGFLEMAVLDMDMVNMGTRARRVMRRAKVQLQKRTVSQVRSGKGNEGEISLAPASDLLLKMIGSRGFEGVKSCVVGVPVTGGVDIAPTPTLETMPEPKSQRLSQQLGSLLSKRVSVAGPQLQNEYPEPAMVSKVAQWWWSRCYEGGNDQVLESIGKEKSIWCDEELLKECENHDTGLKLVIACAVKPEGTGRRKSASL